MKEGDHACLGFAVAFRSLRPRRPRVQQSNHKTEARYGRGLNNFEIYIYIYIHTRAYIYIYTYIYTHIYMYLFISLSLSLYLYIYM